MTAATLEELERCLDNVRDPCFQKIFYGKLGELRADFIKELIETGKDEPRFRIKMIDDILGIEDEIFEEWRARKNSAK